MQVNDECAEITEKPGVCNAAEENVCAATAEKLQDLQAEYDKLHAAYTDLQKQNILEKISRETGCTDPAYLEFCASRQGVAVLDPAALRQFARELAAVSPGCFNARITPGSSAGSCLEKTPAAENRRAVPVGDRIGMIALSIDCAPDAVSR